MDFLKNFLSNRTNLILTLVIIFVGIGAIFGISKFIPQKKMDLPTQEVDLSFEADGPYALLVPRRDGNALTLNITRVSSYDGISYELAYQATGSSAEEGLGSIDRGVQGTLDTKNKSSDYAQEILFGTCSQGYTSGGAHCIFDKNVENGTLILRIKQTPEPKAAYQKIYKMITSWHLQKPDVALGKITSGDGHFSYVTTAKREDLSLIAYTIVNDLSGAPKLPEGKKVQGKVYAFNVPTTRVFPAGDVMIEQIEKPPAWAKIAVYIQKDNKWTILDTKIEGSKLLAKAPQDGIFAVLVDSK